MNYTGELLFGKYPVQRTNPKPEQSKWYYIDPRYNGLGEIDVESENSPNPYENEIKEYLYRNEPEHYKDIYGNEEPVHQNSSTVNQLTGMQTLADNNTFQPISMSVNASTQSLFPTLPPIQGVQLAQNGINKDTFSNNMYDFNKFTLSQSAEELKEFHINREGYKRIIDENNLIFPYPDINGDITSCVGHNMKYDFNKHPWISAKTGKYLSDNQKISEQQKLLNSSTNLKPELYKNVSDARVTQDYCNKLYENDIKQRWFQLAKSIPNWLDMSPEMQAATMDVHFTGNMQPKNSWPLAKKYAKEFNKLKYCENLQRDEYNKKTGIYRPDISIRNNWVDKMCNQGQFYK